MSAFHTIAKWSLRAILLWGAFELATGVYDQALQTWQQTQQISGHQTAMERLEARAAALEERARVAAADALDHQNLWRLPASSAPSPTHEQAAIHLRDALMALGAQAPVVDGASGERALVSLDATWREPQANAPIILHSIAGQYPQLSLRGLKMSALDGADLVSIEAHFATYITEERAP